MTKANSFFIFFLTFTVTALFATIGVDPHHDGLMFKAALDVAQGKQLYRETFTQHGALTVLIQALSLKIFGNYLIVIKLTTAFFYGLTASVLYLTWSQFLSKKTASLAIIVWLTLVPYYVLIFLPWSSVYALFFQGLSLYLLLLYCKNLSENGQKQSPSSISNIYLFLMGITSSLTFWTRQPVGIFLFLALMIFLVMLAALKVKSFSESFKSILLIFLGFLSISAIFFLWLTLTRSWQDWWSQSIVLAFKFGEEYGGAYSLLAVIRRLFVVYTTGIIDSYFIWTFIPISNLFLLLRSLYQLAFEHKQQRSSLQILAVTLVGTASWLQYYPSADIRHTYWAATPMVGGYLYTLGILTTSKGLKATYKVVFKFFLILILTSSLILIMITRVNFAIKKIAKHYLTIDKPQVLRAMRMNQTEAEYYATVYQKMNDYLEKNSAKNFISVGADALYLTFTNRSFNLHPLYVQWDLIKKIYPNYDNALDTYIRENKPLILTKKLPAPDGYYQLDYWPDHQTLLIAPFH